LFSRGTDLSSYSGKCPAHRAPLIFPSNPQQTPPTHFPAILCPQPPAFKTRNSPPDPHLPNPYHPQRPVPFLRTAPQPCQRGPSISLCLAYRPPTFHARLSFLTLPYFSRTFSNTIVDFLVGSPLFFSLLLFKGDSWFPPAHSKDVFFCPKDTVLFRLCHFFFFLLAKHPISPASFMEMSSLLARRKGDSSSPGCLVFFFLPLEPFFLCFDCRF